MSAAPRRTPRAFNWPCLVAVTLLLAVPWAQAMLDDTERHPLESEALAHPDQVLAQLPPLLEAARQRGDQRELALLELAHANACRVVANWDCQRDAGRAAQLAADEAGEPLLAIRALIAESRGLMAKQDYSPGGQLLAEAERRLRRTPSPALMADVQLGYSSMSNFLERHELARTYADRGLQVLGEIAEPLIRARLLRNRGRAEARLGQVEAARASLREAIDVAVAVKDPKLSAELDLELARIARDQGDVATQRASAQRVLALAEQFGHAQLRALGHEVLGEVALERAAKYAGERIVFDRPIGMNQGVQFPIAEAFIEIEAANLMRFKACTLFDAQQPCGAQANMAKYLAAKASCEAANVCLQTHGGFGFANEYDIERKFRETRLYQVAPISTNLIFSYVAEHLLGLPRSF